MPDGRFLAKSVALDLELNGVSLQADYLFTRMIPHLDVEGRLVGHVDQIKSIAVPLRRRYTPELIRSCLGELEEAGLLEWYEVHGRQFVSFPGFSANQKGLRKEREAASTLPSPKVNGAQRVRESLRSDSGVAPDLLPHKLSQGKVSEVKVSQEKLPCATTKKKKPGRVYTDAFETFWRTYPKRTNPGSKHKALALWKKALGEITADALETKAREYADWCRHEGILRTGKVAMATTWLNGKCWEVDLHADPLSEADRKVMKTVSALDGIDLETAFR